MSGCMEAAVRGGIGCPANPDPSTGLLDVLLTPGFTSPTGILASCFWAALVLATGFTAARIVGGIKLPPVVNKGAYMACAAVVALAGYAWWSQPLDVSDFSSGCKARGGRIEQGTSGADYCVGLPDGWWIARHDWADTFPPGVTTPPWRHVEATAGPDPVGGHPATPAPAQSPDGSEDL